MRRALLQALLICTASPALGQGVVTSRAPDSVSISVYRAPDRGSDQAMDLSWLQGYALVTEKRTVTVPAGRSVIRFEGVAAGLFPESAIVSGLPSGVREKNLDADLLSPRSLYARAFGRPVILRRTATGGGRVIEERAVIRSGAEGAAIVQTAGGFEVANCGGPRDELIYTSVPADLSARPTLSIETEADTDRTVTLSLSYLAWGFDWQTNYVVAMNPDGRTADLSAWVTLASSDSTSFADAETAVIAGKVNREDSEPGEAPVGGELVFQCYLQSSAPPPPPPPPPMMAPSAPMMEMADIVVTAQRAAPMKMNVPVTVQQEGLGDLKLYRVPVPVTVAANAQKQVVLTQKTGVKFASLYRSDVWGSAVGEVRQLLRARNRKEDGLGLPLPGGPVTVFEPHRQADGDNAMLLAGEGGLPDLAEGEEVEIELGQSTQVTLDEDVSRLDAHAVQVRLTARNARAVPVRFEARIAVDPSSRLEGASRKLQRKDGRSVWAVTILPNSHANLTYKIVNSD